MSQSSPHDVFLVIRLTVWAAVRLGSRASHMRHLTCISLAFGCCGNDEYWLLTAPHVCSSKRLSSCASRNRKGTRHWGILGKYSHLFSVTRRSGSNCQIHSRPGCYLPVTFLQGHPHHKIARRQHSIRPNRHHHHERYQISALSKMSTTHQRGPYR